MKRVAINYKSIGERIMLRRKSLGISRATLTSWAEISETHLSKIENGKAQLSLNCLVDIANRLYTTPDFLLIDSVPETKPLLLEDVKIAFEDCSPDEVKILLKTVRALKESLRELKITKKKIMLHDE
jgi:transcriptional regulator with XRE-family HTH domain